MDDNIIKCYHWLKYFKGSKKKVLNRMSIPGDINLVSLRKEGNESLSRIPPFTFGGPPFRLRLYGSHVQDPLV